MTRTMLFTGTALALLIGAGATFAQSGGDVRSTDRKIEKSLDNKELTPVRPIRKVGDNSWPPANNAAPTKVDEPGADAKSTSQQTPPPTAQQNPPQTPQKDEQAKQIDGARHSDRDKDPSQRDKDHARQNEPQANKSSFADIRLGTDANGHVAVNADQERQLTATLRKQRVKPVAANISVKIGMAVPADVRLGSVSADLVAVLPQFRGYSFFATREEIVIVEPASQKIVALIPAKVTATTSTAPRNRSVERTTTQTWTRTPIRPAPIQRDVTVGSGVQDDEVIIEQRSPATIYREVPVYPGYRTYRTMPPADGSLVIYPPRSSWSPGD